MWTILCAGARVLCFFLLTNYTISDALCTYVCTFFAFIDPWEREHNLGAWCMSNVFNILDVLKSRDELLCIRGGSSVL